MAPSSTMQQWFGITLTTFAPGAMPSSFSMESPATTLTRIFPSHSTFWENTSATCFGLTASTRTSAAFDISSAVS